MKHVLIITEDIVKIQLLSGFFGRLYSRLYIYWCNVRLKVILFFLTRRYRVSVLLSDCLKINHRQKFIYSAELSKINYAVNRQLYWQIVAKILKPFNFNQSGLTAIIKTRLATYLTYHYFVYADLYQKIISQTKPDKIIVIGSSYHAAIAVFLAQTASIPVQKIILANLSVINIWLNRFFLHREYLTKLLMFFKQSAKIRPGPAQLANAVFLSLDFFRHLKILAPIYLQLAKVNKNPWFITDIPKPKIFLRNLNLPDAKYFHLASFLSRKEILTQIILQEKTVYQAIKRQLYHPKQKSNSLKDFLSCLGLNSAWPIILHGLTLSQLSLRAGEKLFAQVKPNRVVVVSDARFTELTLALLAKKFSVPSLMISPNTLLDLAKINPYNNTDRIAVVGEFIKNKLINLNLSKEKIFVTGDPSLENNQLPSPVINREAVFNQLNLNPGKKIILLISFRANWLIPAREKKKFILMSLAAAKKQPEAVLVIKPHPTETKAGLEEELSRWGVTDALVVDNHQFSLYTLLHASSIILQTWSMTLFEAVMLDRPVICVNPFHKNYDFFLPVIRRGGAVEIYSQSELNQWLKILLNSHSPLTQQKLLLAKTAVAAFIKKPDGQATQRVLKLLV